MHRFFVSPTLYRSNLRLFSDGDLAPDQHRAAPARRSDGWWCSTTPGASTRLSWRSSRRAPPRAGFWPSHPAGGEPRTHLTLYLGLTQREKFEWMLQKCTEVGAAEFIPVITSRGLVQSPEESRARLERWQRILQEAAEQSGRGRIPILSAAAALGGCPAPFPGQRCPRGDRLGR